MTTNITTERKLSLTSLATIFNLASLGIIREADVYDSIHHCLDFNEIITLKKEFNINKKDIFELNLNMLTQTYTMRLLNITTREYSIGSSDGVYSGYSFIESKLYKLIDDQ